MTAFTLSTDAYHHTMGYWLSDPMAEETHVLYARRGGPQVVIDLVRSLAGIIAAVPTPDAVHDASRFWAGQGIPFPSAAWLSLTERRHLPISVRGVRDGEVVRPGDPIAVVRAPAFLAGVLEPLLIGEQMAAVQLATRMTKLACAVQWKTERLFEVGYRAVDGYDEHIRKLMRLKRAGLKATSHGLAARQWGLKAVGTMGHRFTQRFTGAQCDLDAFHYAVDRMLAFIHQQGITDPIPLSLLLDTRSTLEHGLPAALQLIRTRMQDIQGRIDISVRLDSGDLHKQFAIIAESFLGTFQGGSLMPGIVLESGLNARDVADFEQLADSIGFNRNKLYYGLGGYLVSGIQRDTISLVYKLTAFQSDGRMNASMKFGDETNAGKESYPGDIELWEGKKDGRIVRELALRQETPRQLRKSYRPLFVDLVINGRLQKGALLSDAQVQTRVRQRWQEVTQSYIGDDRDFYAVDDPDRRRPYFTPCLQALVDRLRLQQFS